MKDNQHQVSPSEALGARLDIFRGYSRRGVRSSPKILLNADPIEVGVLIYIYHAFSHFRCTILWRERVSKARLGQDSLGVTEL
jgi:hypothetical protein